MTIWVLVAGALTLSASYWLTYLIGQTAGSIGLIDVPNERSSHAHPTPRGGGLAIAISSLAAMGLLAALGFMPVRVFLAIAPGGVAVATVGFIDDIRPLSARIRLFVHFAAAAWAVGCIGPIEFFHRLPSDAPELTWLGYLISTVGIVWFLNMFNFMDGIDGIAASQAVFMASGVVLLALFSKGIAYTATTAFAIGAASGGFLLLNWPPAKIFMGDVGSGYLGYVFAVLGVASGTHSVYGPWTYIILAGVFAVDATVVVVRRFLRGDRVTEAHRTHAFQLLAQKIGHRNVTLSIGLVNVLWLLPCALASVLRPNDAMWFTAAALTPVILCALLVGAGSSNSKQIARERSATVLQFHSAARRAVSAASRHYQESLNQFSAAANDRTITTYNVSAKEAVSPE